MADRRVRQTGKDVDGDIRSEGPGQRGLYLMGRPRRVTIPRSRWISWPLSQVSLG